MSNVDPGKWWSFVEAWIGSFEKGSFAWKEAVIAQSHNLDVQSFSNSLLWARSWEFFALSRLENPCFGNLENPVTNSCTNAAYQIQTQAYPVRSSGAWRQKWITSMPHENTKRHLLRFRPIISMQVYEFPAADTSPFLPPRVKNNSLKLFHSQEALFMSFSYICSYKAIFQLTTPISHRIDGLNITSAVRTIWVTAYTTNFKTQATFGCETTHPLVCCSLKHDIHWICCERQQKLKPHRRVVWIIEPPNPEKHNVMGWKKMGQFLVLGNAIDGSPPIVEMRLGHVWICLCMSQTVILGLFSTNFQLENKSLHLPWIRIYTAYVLESRLISMDGATQIPISEFEARRWHNSRVCALSGL